MQARGVELVSLIEEIQEDLIAALIARGDQGILVTYMVVERTFGGPHICGDLIEGRSIYALTIEEPRCRREDPPSLLFQDRLAVKDTEGPDRQGCEIDRLGLRRFAPCHRPAVQQQILRDHQEVRTRNRPKR